MGSTISITNETRTKLPRISFGEIASTILGKKYELSLIFIAPAKMKRLNSVYRNKNVPTDILSFPLSKKEGEIYICPSAARAEARKFGRTYENFIAFLFIHGCVHLKGHEHSATMESIEEKIRRKFGI